MVMMGVIVVIVAILALIVAFIAERWNERQAKP